MTVTTNTNDPRLGHGFDSEPVPQNDAYLVLSQEEIDKGFVRPVRLSYIHTTCGTVTSMNQKIAEETPETIRLNHIDAVNQEMMRHAKTIYELDKQYITKIARYEEDELRRQLRQDNSGL